MASLIKHKKVSLEGEIHIHFTNGCHQDLCTCEVSFNEYDETNYHTVEFNKGATVLTGYYETSC